MRTIPRLLLVAMLVACSVGVGVELSVTSERAAAAEAAGSVEQARARSKTTAWIVTWDRPRVLASLRTNRARIGRISPYWFRLRSDGTRVENRQGAMDRDVLQLADGASIPVVPTVTNEFDPVRTSTMLRTPASRARHVRQLVGLAARTEFSGIDVDYERIAAGDRARFTAFVEALATALHARDRTLTVSVPPVTHGAAPGAAAYDFEAIGAAADEVRVLAYDYSTYCGGSGPIAPADWVERVIEFTKGEVSRRKVVLGAPLYGYDWPSDGCATSRTWRDTTAMRVRHAGVLAWSVPWQSRRMRYTVRGVRRIVWFEDSASTAAKARLVEEHRLKGIALWRLGGEDPRTWSALERVLGQPRP